MGMLNALLDIGKVLVEDKIPKTGITPREVALECTTQMPMAEGTEIQIWLDVEDPTARPLNVMGVHRVTLADVDPRNKSRYLYRDPEGPSSSYRYSPVVRMQKKELDFDETYLKKLETKVLKDFETDLPSIEIHPTSNEKFRVFRSGSIHCILKGLIRHRDELVCLVRDAKHAAKQGKKTESFLLVFGFRYGENFLYPGDYPVNNLFNDYFFAKMEGIISKNKAASCFLCQKKEMHAINIDMIYKFSTFDKRNFLPGNFDTPEKTLPICRKCFYVLSKGNEHTKTYFQDNILIKPLHILVIPESFGGEQKPTQYGLERETKDFFNAGIQNSQRLFDYLLRKKTILAYHFLFWEQPSGSSQQRIHLMAEDIPPLRLTRLLHTWRRSCHMFLKTEQSPSGSTFLEKEQSLSAGMSFVFGVLGSFAGKSKQDQTAMRDLALAVTGKLLQDEPVDLGLIKGIVCARLPGLLKDPNKPMKDKIPPVRRAERLVDFLARVNQDHFGHHSNHGEEEINVQNETMRPGETTAVSDTMPGKPLRKRMEEMLEGFADPYLQEPFGQGVFLAGVVLGVFALEQVGKGGDLGSAPLFKQLHFGRLRRRDLQGQFGRLPGLVHQYRVPHGGAIQSLAGEVARLLLEGTPKELGAEGNFAFAAGFLSAPNYFWRCFGKTAPQEETADEIPPGEEVPQNTEDDEEAEDNGQTTRQIY